MGAAELKSAYTIFAVPLSDKATTVWGIFYLASDFLINFVLCNTRISKQKRLLRISSTTKTE
jgi:hypothetical protein